MKNPSVHKEKFHSDGLKPKIVSKFLFELSISKKIKKNTKNTKNLEAISECKELSTTVWTVNDVVSLCVIPQCL